MKRLLFSSFLLFFLVTVSFAQNPSTARRIRYGTPPVVCNPSTGDVYIDTTVTPPDFVRCVATNKWERESVGKVNAQTGTTYTFLKADRNKLVTFSNGSAIAATLPQATAAGDFLSGWNVPVFNLGAGTVTVTPTTSTINGGATITFATGEGGWIFSNGTNYSALKTISTTSGAGTVTTTGSPVNGNLTKFSGANSITNADLTGDVTTLGGVATTFAAKADVAESRLFCSDAGANDTYACDLSPAITSYVTGTHYRFKANTANTGTATINLNSLGAKTIKKLNDQDLANSDIEAGQWVDLVYDGTNMQMQSQIANSAAGGIGGSTGVTDNAILRADGTGGATLQSSPLGLDDTTGKLDWPDAEADKMHLYANEFGFGVESGALTTWYNGMFRFRSGGTSRSGGTEVVTIDSNSLNMAGAFTIELSTGSINFGTSTGDKVKLFGNDYGLGIEANNLTNWTNNSFRWRTGGSSVSTGTEIMTLDSGGNLVVVGTILGDRKVTAHTGDNTVTAVASGSFFTNTGAGGAIVFTLPTPVVGMTYEFYRDANQTVTLDIAGAVTIRVGTSVTSAGGNVTLDAVGSRIRIVAISTTQWVGDLTGTATFN